MSSQRVIRCSVHINLFGWILAPMAKLSQPNMLPCFHAKPKKHFNAAAAGQVKLNCLRPKPELGGPPAQRIEKWRRLEAFITPRTGAPSWRRCTLAGCWMADAHWGPMHMTFCYQSRHARLSPTTLNHCFTQREP